MDTFLARAAHNRPAQFAATAVVAGAVAAGLLLGFQHHAHDVRLRRLKQAVGEEEAELQRRLARATADGEDHAPDREPDHDPDHLDDEDRRAIVLARRAQAGDYAEDVVLEQLARTLAFLTPPGLQRVRDAVVVVVGCGGVGSHCAAALARSGVGRIRLVDFDQVSLSSLNRHAVATLADVGRPKVRVLARRLRAVAPWVRFDARVAKFEAAAADALLGGWDDEAVAGEDSRNDTNNGRPSGTKPTSIGDGGAHHGRPPTFIVDAIDNIDTKVELLRYCHAHGLPVVASMGAGTKSDPTRVVVGDLGASTADGLSRAVRRRLKLLGITHGIPAVYSTEMTKDAEEEPNTTTSGISKAALLPLPEEQFAKGKAAVRELGALPTFRVRILPVLGTLPAVFGHTVANHILLTVSGYPYEYSAVKGRDKLYDQILGVVLAAEERLVRHREATLVNGGTPPPDDKDVASDKEAATKKAAKTAKKAAAGPGPSAAVGLRIPLTAGDVAFLVEEVYHGRSAVSGLPTRTTLVRWALPPDDDGTSVDGLLQRIQPAAAAAAADDDDHHPASDKLLREQRAARLKLADLVCMTREEASRHTAAVLLGGGQSPADLYDAETLARIEARRRVAAAYEQYRV